MTEAILFDLDGTLLPMDNDKFTKAYFSLLASAAREWGYGDSELLIKGIWSGVKAMVTNCGSITNSEAFWKCFDGLMGKDCRRDIPSFDNFYLTDFHKAKEVTFPAPLAKKAVASAREKASKVILATNPLFPAEGVKTRLSWIGLSVSDFDFVTDYSNSSYCKPNPSYYTFILEKCGIKAENAVMIGNDYDEDIDASKKAGIEKSFLLTDFVINRENKPVDCESGSYEDMIEFINRL